MGAPSPMNSLKLKLLPTPEQVALLDGSARLFTELVRDFCRLLYRVLRREEEPASFPNGDKPNADDRQNLSAYVRLAIACGAQNARDLFRKLRPPERTTKRRSDASARTVLLTLQDDAQAMLDAHHAGTLSESLDPAELAASQEIIALYPRAIAFLDRVNWSCAQAHSPFPGQAWYALPQIAGGRFAVGANIRAQLVARAVQLLAANFGLRNNFRAEFESWTREVPEWNRFFGLLPLLRRFEEEFRILRSNNPIAPRTVANAEWLLQHASTVLPGGAAAVTDEVRGIVSRLRAESDRAARGELFRELLAALPEFQALDALYREYRRRVQEEPTWTEPSYPLHPVWPTFPHERSSSGDDYRSFTLPSKVCLPAAKGGGDLPPRAAHHESWLGQLSLPIFVDAGPDNPPMVQRITLSYASSDPRLLRLQPYVGDGKGGSAPLGIYCWNERGESQLQSLGGAKLIIRHQMQTHLPPGRARVRRAARSFYLSLILESFDPSSLKRKKGEKDQPKSAVAKPAKRSRGSYPLLDGEKLLAVAPDQRRDRLVAVVGVWDHQAKKLALGDIFWIHLQGGRDPVGKGMRKPAVKGGAGVPAARNFRIFRPVRKGPQLRDLVDLALRIDRSVSNGADHKGDNARAWRHQRNTIEDRTKKMAAAVLAAARKHGVRAIVLPSRRKVQSDALLPQGVNRLNRLAAYATMVERLKQQLGSRGLYGKIRLSELMSTYADDICCHCAGRGVVYEVAQELLPAGEAAGELGEKELLWREGHRFPFFVAHAGRTAGDNVVNTLRFACMGDCSKGERASNARALNRDGLVNRVRNLAHAYALGGRYAPWRVLAEMESEERQTGRDALRSEAEPKIRVVHGLEASTD